MKTISFMEGVLVALIASLSGHLAYRILLTVFPAVIVVKFMTALLGFCYITYLLKRSPESSGHLTVVIFSVLVTLTTGFSGLSTDWFLLIQIGLIWLVRSLYFHSDLISTVADLVLSLSGLILMLWAFSQTNNIFLSLWCFFLAQALFVIFPEMSEKNTATDSLYSPNDEEFQRAYRSAQAAVQKLTQVL